MSCGNRGKIKMIQRASTVELHLSGLTGKASHLDMQKSQIIGFFFESAI
jgi:hypothetical protein